MFVGFSQADNLASLYTINKNHEEQAQINISDTIDSLFAVILAVINPNYCRIPFKLTRQRHRYAMLGYIDSIFGGIEYNSHVNYCTYRNNLYQIIPVCTFDKISRSHSMASHFSGWPHLIAQAKQLDIGMHVDTTMDAIEKENPSLNGVLPKVYVRQNLDSISNANK